MSQFYLPESSTTSTTAPSPHHSPKTNPIYHSTDDYSSYHLDNDDEDDLDTLPYPEELPRSDFLAPDFDPQKYLSTLRNRHQTLEDLRADLRSRSNLLSRELLDLVNTNYDEFLTLGSTLQRGDEKVENVKVGVLGFRRQVEGVRDVVATREREVKHLLDEKRAVRKRVLVARKLLDIDERLTELETRMMIQPVTNGTREADHDNYHDDDDNEQDEDEDDDDDDIDDQDDDETTGARATNAAVSRLAKHAQLYLLLQHLIQQVGPDHPFVALQHHRTVNLRKTLLLDLGAALKQAKKDGKPAGHRTLNLLSIYRALGEGEHLMSLLKA